MQDQNSLFSAINSRPKGTLQSVAVVLSSVVIAMESHLPVPKLKAHIPSHSSILGSPFKDIIWHEQTAQSAEIITAMLFQ